MYEYYFIFRSVTRAQSAAIALRHHGIEAALVNAPGTISPNGCSYAVKIKSADSYFAASCLRQANISYTHVYRVSRGLPAEEVYL